MPGALGWLRSTRACRLRRRRAFAPASIRKQLVALLLLACGSGRPSLDDSPDRYLPQLRSAGFDPRLTLWQLAQMRSGLPDYWCVAMLTGAQPDAFPLRPVLS